MSLILSLTQQVSPAVTPENVTTTVQAFTDFLLKYLIALAAVGGLSMALIEAAKALYDYKTKFQAKRWTRLIRDTWRGDQPATAVGAATATQTQTFDADREAAFAQLLQLCTGISSGAAGDEAKQLLASGGSLPLFSSWTPSNAHALFALDLPRMMGSIQDAADIALNTPKKYPALYRLMVWGADPDDVNGWVSDADTVVLTSGTGPATPAERASAKSRADRYTSLKMVVKRKLDAFQLRAGDRYATSNQFAANILGAAILFVVLTRLDLRLEAAHQLNVVTMVAISLFGGVLAPVAKDLVTALQKVRNG